MAPSSRDLRAPNGAANKQIGWIMPRKKFQWTRNEDDPAGDLHFAERANRSDRKKESDRLDALVRDLVKMKPDQIIRMPLSEPAQAATQEARRLKAKGGVKGGMRRQLLFVAGVLRQEEDEDLAALFAAVQKITGKR